MMMNMTLRLDNAERRVESSRVRQSMDSRGTSQVKYSTQCVSKIYHSTTVVTNATHDGAGCEMGEARSHA